MTPNTSSENKPNLVISNISEKVEIISTDTPKIFYTQQSDFLAIFIERPTH
jgi:hypothetical protein